MAAAFCQLQKCLCGTAPCRAFVGEGLSLKELSRIRLRLDDLCLPYTIDHVDYGNTQDLRVKAHIDRKGIVPASRKEKNDSLLPAPLFILRYQEAPMKKLLLVIAVLILGGCMGMPQSLRPVSDFELNRYLGKWYEIARLDHSFERGLSHVSAEYTLRKDGGVRVLNRGFLASENRWKEAEGKACFVGKSSEGYLKVSFFGPFYGSYVIFGLDHENYQYAFVSGPDTKYLWLLSRTPVVEPQILEKFIETSRAAGFDTDALIFVEQN